MITKGPVFFLVKMWAIYPDRPDVLSSCVEQSVKARDAIAAERLAQRTFDEGAIIIHTDTRPDYRYTTAHGRWTNKLYPSDDGQISHVEELERVDSLRT